MLFVFGALIVGVTAAITATIMILDSVIKAERRGMLGEAYRPPRRLTERLRERIALRWDATKRIR